MPTYEYLCEKCDCTFEKFQPIADKALTVCPRESCPQKKWGKGKVRRQIGAGAGLLFKGSGFYITDYRSENYKQAAKKETSTSSDAGGKSGSEGSKAAKPAAKAADKPAAKNKAA